MARRRLRRRMLTLDAILMPSANEEERAARYIMREREEYELAKREAEGHVEPTGRHARGHQRPTRAEGPDLYRIRRPWPSLPGVDTFPVMCPRSAKRYAKRIGVAFVMPHRSDLVEGGTRACLDRIRDRQRETVAYNVAHSPGCREFPSRKLAIEWLKKAADELKC